MKMYYILPYLKLKEQELLFDILVLFRNKKITKELIPYLASKKVLQTLHYTRYTELFKQAKKDIKKLYNKIKRIIIYIYCKLIIKSIIQSIYNKGKLNE